MEKVLEAGAELAGGHSIDDKEPKYGLAVTGVARPDEIVYNGGAEAGDKLVLTKRLGIGVLASALKNGVISEADMMPAIEEAAVLNAAAAAAMAQVGVHACTDVSGFGLAGHLGEMLDASGAAAVVHLAALPLHDGVLDLIARQVYAGGLRNNRDFLLPRLHEEGPAGAAEPIPAGVGGGRPVRRPRRRAGSARARAVRPADLRRPAAGRRAREARAAARRARARRRRRLDGRRGRRRPHRRARARGLTACRPTTGRSAIRWGEDGRIDPDELGRRGRGGVPPGRTRRPRDLVIRALSVVPFLLVAALGLIGVVGWVLIIVLFGVGTGEPIWKAAQGLSPARGAVAAAAGRAHRARAGPRHARRFVGDRARLQRGLGPHLLDA